jgi:aminopeptidase YwaD
MQPIRYGHIRDDALALCEIGNRFAGTPGELEARGYIGQRFRDVGLVNVREEMFEVATYRPLVAQCELIGIGSSSRLSCVGLQFTGTGDVESEAVYLGALATSADLERALSIAGDVAGRIAVLKCPYPYLFSEILISEGVVAIVDISDAPDGHICHLNAMMYPALAACVNGTRLSVPGVTVERSDADRLIEHISISSRRIRVLHDADYDLVMTANVIGELQGVDATTGRAVIGAHYDSQLEGVGASDNASGIGSLIEVARALADQDPQRTLVFAAFADEEGGFRGSTQYCRQHQQTLNDTVGMVNIDAPGWAPSQRSLHADAAMREFALESAARVNWSPEEVMDASAFPGSDHNPFIDAGVPACFFWRHPPTHPYYHTAGDTPDLLDFRIVAETASVAGVTLERLGSEPTLQLGRARPVRRWLDLRPEASTQEVG